MKKKKDEEFQNENNRMMAKLKKLDGSVLSIFKVVESHPSQFKSIIDGLFHFK